MALVQSLICIGEDIAVAGGVNRTADVIGAAFGQPDRALRAARCPGQFRGVGRLSV